jgi:hypothetical protein
MTAIELARHLLPGWKEERGSEGVHVFTHRSSKMQLFTALAIRTDATLENVRIECAHALETDRVGIECAHALETDRVGK